jgi:hypothetical protein
VKIDFFLKFQKLKVPNFYNSKGMRIKLKISSNSLKTPPIFSMLFILVLYLLFFFIFLIIQKISVCVCVFAVFFCLYKHTHEHVFMIYSSMFVPNMINHNFLRNTSLAFLIPIHPAWGKLVFIQLLVFLFTKG